MNSALIIVDVQNDFLPGGSLAVPDGDAIISFVAELMQADQGYELIVATQDWHPDKHGSFASAHSGSQPFQLGELNGLEQVFWPDHCVQGTFGADFVETLNVERVIHPNVGNGVVRGVARDGHIAIGCTKLEGEIE